MYGTEYAIAYLIVAAIGTGVSVYGQRQAAKSAAGIAELNARQAERNARLSLLGQQAAANFAKREAEANFTMRSAEAAARFSNAKAIEEQVFGQDRINRANMTKRREEYARAEGTMRANIAASGLVESSGTPADLLAEAAGIMQRDLEEQHYESEQQRNTLFREASLERLGGQLALAGATLDRDSSVAAATLNASAARASFFSSMRGAQITRLTGAANASAMRTQANATLISGAASLAGSAYQFDREGAFNKSIFQTS